LIEHVKHDLNEKSVQPTKKADEKQSTNVPIVILKELNCAGCFGSKVRASMWAMLEVIL
jgi:hypothetical protein